MRVEAGGEVEEASVALVGHEIFARGGDCVEGVAVFALAAWVGDDGLPERLLLFTLARHQRPVFKARELAAIDLQAVLHAVQLVLRAAGLLFTLRHVSLQHRLAVFERAYEERDRGVAQVFEICDRVEARGRAGVACDER